MWDLDSGKVSQGLNISLIGNQSLIIRGFQLNSTYGLSLKIKTTVLPLDSIALEIFFHNRVSQPHHTLYEIQVREIEKVKRDRGRQGKSKWGQERMGGSKQRQVGRTLRETDQ